MSAEAPPRALFDVVTEALAREMEASGIGLRCAARTLRAAGLQSHRLELLSDVTADLYATKARWVDTVEALARRDGEEAGYALAETREPAKLFEIATAWALAQGVTLVWARWVPEKDR